QPRIKSIKLPTFFLNMLLQIYRSGSGCFANRYYSAEKLFSTGFQRSISISNAISDFVGAVDNLNLVAKKEGSRQNE
ncbi:MAG: hypothetical protein ACD_46C00176G0001, partial [uncultured bacterium]